MVAAHDLQQNHLQQNRPLAALPASDFERLKSNLTLVQPPLGAVRIGQPLASGLFSSHGDRLTALHDGGRRLRRNRDRWP